MVYYNHYTGTSFAHMYLFRGTPSFETSKVRCQKNMCQYFYNLEDVVAQQNVELWFSIG